jgi:release factor glutamine methyltransferase
LARKIVSAQSNEPPYTDPYVRWCGRGGAARLPPIPIRVSDFNRQLSTQGSTRGFEMDAITHVSPASGGARSPAGASLSDPSSDPSGFFGPLTDTQDLALLSLGLALKSADYRFTTITPASHHLVNARAGKPRAQLSDIFGWNRPFQSGDLAADLLEHLSAAGALETTDQQLRSAVRFSTLGHQLLAHSSFPTEQGDAVFFGPDTYRFARMIRQSLAEKALKPGARILDIGSGSGAGGLHAAALADPSAKLVLTDINQSALRFSRINAALNGARNVEIAESDLFAAVEGQFDLIVSNPPYLVDPLARLYRHGGGALGSGLSVNIAEQGIAHLTPGGRLLLYTGSAIVAGKDAFYETLAARLSGRPVRFCYEEIDPDVFGEELAYPPYDQADRIAVVAVTIEAA